MLRRAPAAALLLPPGAEPARRTWWGWGGALAVALTLGVVVVSVWPRAWDAVDAHERVVAATHDLIFESSPDNLSLALNRRGVSGLLSDVPDLAPYGLALVGARTAGDAVVLLYRDDTGAWTLQHVDGGALPAGEPVLAAGDVRVWTQDAVSIGGWRESSGAWMLVGTVPTTRMLEVAHGLREHRLHPVPPARSVFDAL